MERKLRFIWYDGFSERISGFMGVYSTIQEEVYNTICVMLDEKVLGIEETAIKLRKAKVDVAIITEVTKLSVEEVKELEKTLFEKV